MEEKREEFKPKITIEELASAAQKYINGDFSDEEMNEYGGTIQVRGYMPLTEKITLIMSLMNVYEYTDYNSQEIRVADMYKNLFFYVLLGGYAFVDCSNKEMLNSVHVNSIGQHTLEIFIIVLTEI